MFLEHGQELLLRLNDFGHIVVVLVPDLGQSLIVHGQRILPSIVNLTSFIVGELGLIHRHVKRLWTSVRFELCFGGLLRDSDGCGVFSQVFALGNPPVPTILEQHENKCLELGGEYRGLWTKKCELDPVGGRSKKIGANGTELTSLSTWLTASCMHL